MTRLLTVYFTLLAFVVASLWVLRIRSPVSFQKIDCAPNGKPRTEGNHKGLQNVYRGIIETHSIYLFVFSDMKKGLILNQALR
jgi:hypothetical protein